jgi:hypothetical protein
LDQERGPSVGVLGSFWGVPRKKRDDVEGDVVCCTAIRTLRTVGCRFVCSIFCLCVRTFWAAAALHFTLSNLVHAPAFDAVIERAPVIDGTTVLPLNK